MIVSSFNQLRSLLTQLSSMSALDQFSYVHKANAALDGLCSEPSLADLHRSATSLIAADGNGSPRASECLRWVRWRDQRKDNGVALTLLAGLNRYILFPRNADPEAFKFLPSGDGRSESKPGILKLLPGRETLARLWPEFEQDNNYEPHLAYVHRDFLYAVPRPSDDLVRYARFLRLAHEGGVPPLPSFHTLQEGSFPYGIEEQRGSPHAEMLALHQGMDYLLGTLHRRSAPYGMMSLRSAAALYPAPAAVLKDEPDLRDALPDAACFGSGDPLMTKLRVEVRDRKLFKASDGSVMGWARIAAGGREDRQADPASGLSAATSKGGRPYQQDGFYLAHFRSNDCEGGRDVRVFVGVDGMGGTDEGEMASSAALQGAHAGILRALRDQRLPLAEDLFDAAREALEYQTLRKEMEDGVAFTKKKAPDTVIAVCVVVDGEATIATAGDFLLLHCRRNASGRLEVAGHATVDAMGEHSVHNTLRTGKKRLYRQSLPNGSWLVAASDGTMGGLVPDFKTHTSREYRRGKLGAYPDQSRFYNLLHVLEHAPAHYAGPALHDAASGNNVIPGGGADPDAGTAEYPALGLIDPENDNWTAAALYWEGPKMAAKSEPLIPPQYGCLESVYPAYQFVHEDGPYNLRFPPLFKELFVGHRQDPQGRPTVVLGDDKVGSPHIRLERIIEKDADGNETESLFVEKLVGAGRVVLLDEKDKRIASLTRKGSRHEIKWGQLIRLTPRSFFRLKKT